MIVGIAGRKGHGKDAVAEMLEVRGFEVVRFVGPLKAMLAAFYREHGLDEGLIERKLEGDLKEAPCPLLRGRSPRYAMQTLGTEWGRQLIADDLWVESLATRAQGYDNVVVPDVRFANECATLRALGAKVLRVDASKRVPDNETSAHVSEASVGTLPVDLEISNNGTMFELSVAVEAALDAL